MKHFIQQNTNKTLLKTSFGLILFFLVIQQGFGQCVQCDGTTTSGLFPSAIGRYTKATGNYSFAGGIYSEANGSASIAFGNRSYANGANSVVLGMFLKSNSSPAIVLGAGFDENNRLENAVSYSMMIGFGSTKPTFFVGPSSGVNNTGKIGIGNVTAPNAKLHIRADAGEDADLLLEPGGGNKTALIRLGQNNSISARDGGDMHFETETDQAFVFENGNVGIGTSQPEAKLHISGDLQVGSQQDPQDIRLHGSINASGNLATAFGYGNNASGGGSAVIGFRSEANQQGSIAIGKDLVVSRNYSIVIGSGKDDTRRLINNIPQSLMIGFDSEYPTFFVSPPQAGYITGRIGIGNVTNLQAKLHLRADAGEDADLLLEPGGEDQTALLRLGQNNSISARDGSDMHFETTADKAFVFHQGDIFLKDIQSGIIMKSPNGQCWRGTMTDQGSLSFEQATCPDAGTTSLSQQQHQGSMKVYPNPTGSKITVEIISTGQQGRLLVFSPDGKQLSQTQIKSSKTELDLGWYLSGTYLIQLEINGQVVESTKVMKR